MSSLRNAKEAESWKESIGENNEDQILVPSRFTNSLNHVACHWVVDCQYATLIEAPFLSPPVLTWQGGASPKVDHRRPKPRLGCLILFLTSTIVHHAQAQAQCRANFWSLVCLSFSGLAKICDSLRIKLPFSRLRLIVNITVRFTTIRILSLHCTHVSLQTRRNINLDDEPRIFVPRSTP